MRRPGHEMIRGSAVIVVVALVIGCGRGDRDDRTAATQRCADAFGEMAHAETSSYTQIYARGCADLYRVSECHDVVARLAEINPAERLVTLARTCALAYCASIRGPAPELCIPGASKLKGEALATAWKQLDAHILGLELGRDPRSPDVQRMGGAFPHEIEIEVPRAASQPTPPANQRLDIVATSDRLVLRLDGREWRVPLSPTRADLAPLVDALDKHVGLTIATSPDTQYAVIMAIITAAHDAGISEVAFSTDTP